jgi:hypothetical protein
MDFQEEDRLEVLVEHSMELVEHSMELVEHLVQEVH